MRFTPTNSATDSKGVGFGMEGNLFAPILFSVFFSILMLIVMFQSGIGREWAVWERYVFAFLPTIFTAAYVLMFFHKRPPRYHKDFWDARIFGGDFRVHNVAERPHPVVLSKQATVARMRR